MSIERGFRNCPFQLPNLPMCVSAMSLLLCPTLQPDGLGPARLLCPWESPGQSTGVGCHVLQGVFPTQASNWHLLRLLHRGRAPVPPGKPPEPRMLGRISQTKAPHLSRQTFCWGSSCIHCHDLSIHR